mmetsp:Transcript_8592/g.19772  ORF Transcript_8592/g.19772 Transcript_8592/m.19772 type:complete len:169 (+) Transcript_8592:35-541(+)
MPGRGRPRKWDGLSEKARTALEKKSARNAIYRSTDKVATEQSAVVVAQQVGADWQADMVGQGVPTRQVAMLVDESSPRGPVSNPTGFKTFIRDKLETQRCQSMTNAELKEGMDWISHVLGRRGHYFKRIVGKKNMIQSSLMALSANVKVYPAQQKLPCTASLSARSCS